MSSSALIDAVVVHPSQGGRPIRGSVFRIHAYPPTRAPWYFVAA